MFMTFYGKTRATPEVYKHAHESPYVMLLPLGVLALGAIGAGFAFKHYFVGPGASAFWGSVFESGYDDAPLSTSHHSFPEWVAWSPTIAMLIGFAIAWLFYIRSPHLPEQTARIFKPLYLFFLNKWYFDELYDWLFVRPAHRIGRFLWKIGDQGIIDGIIDGTARSVGWATGRIVKLQSGYLYHYAFAMLIGLALLLTYFIMTGGAFK